MGATKYATVSHVDRDHSAMPRRVKGLSTLRATIVSFGENKAGEKRDS